MPTSNATDQVYSWRKANLPVADRDVARLAGEGYEWGSISGNVEGSRKFGQPEEFGLLAKSFTLCEALR